MVAIFGCRGRAVRHGKVPRGPRTKGAVHAVEVGWLDSHARAVHAS